MLTKRELFAGAGAMFLSNASAAIALPAALPTLESLFGEAELEDVRKREQNSGLFEGQRFAVSKGFRAQFTSYLLDRRPVLIEFFEPDRYGIDLGTLLMFERHGRIRFDEMTHIYIATSDPSGDLWGVRLNPFAEPKARSTGGFVQDWVKIAY